MLEKKGDKEEEEDVARSTYCNEENEDDKNDINDGNDVGGEGKPEGK